MEKAVMTIRQCAQTYGLPEFFIRRAVKERRFPVLQAGNRSYITPAAIETYLATGGQAYEPATVHALYR